MLNLFIYLFIKNIEMDQGIELGRLELFLG